MKANDQDTEARLIKRAERANLSVAAYPTSEGASEDLGSEGGGDHAKETEGERAPSTFCTGELAS